MLTVHHLPTLRAPALLCACAGWSDAASAASGALGYLMMKWTASRFAAFDPEALYAYTSTRPTTLRLGGVRTLQWPDFAFHALPLPHAERDLVLLTGPEPDLRWQAVAESIVDLAGRIGVELVLTLGAFYATVPHNARVPLFGISGDPDLLRRLRDHRIGDTEYQGPTSFVTALGDAATRRAIPAAGLWAAAPSYLPGTPNPKVSAALLEAVEQLLGCDLGLAELRAAGHDLQERVDRALRERPDLDRFVRRLAFEEPEESESEASAEAEPQPDELPSPEALLKDLESYLRQLQQSSDGDQSGQD